MLLMFLSMLESDEDRKKFIEIYEEYCGLMERAALSIVKDQHNAEEAVQNSFVQIIRHFEKIYEIPCKELRFWIISIVKNEARMIIRKQKNVIQLEDWDGFIAGSENISEYPELVQLFSKLPETYRAALEMKILLDYSGKEIAQRLGLSEEAVHTRISRGRKLLRDIAEKEGFHR
ncbi:MAG: RNA polymerase sigma factor [Firmicutes bacterium]|nr:RNA polymerase sigma factor [Bacillota bacterium]